MRLPLKLYLFFAISAFTLGSVGYILLRTITPDERVFGALFRMFLYHDAHPFQYIALVAVIYAAIATAAAPCTTRLMGRRRSAAILGIIIAALLAASVPGGMLWKIHDMQAGYFTTGERFLNDLAWGATKGLLVGWLIIVSSIPYNILGLILGYAVTHRGFQMAAASSDVPERIENDGGRG